MGYYSNYLNICQEAITDRNMFQNYRRQKSTKGVVETLGMHQGYNFILEIEKEYPYLLKHLKKFATSDNIGNPKMYYYDKIKMHIAPTTLRYIKVLGELLSIFGSLDDMNIVEIGVGYGGQCKIIHDWCHPKSYTIVDFPNVLRLSQKFLSQFGITVTLRGIFNESKIDYDLCISNYAFSEIEKSYQEFYNKHIIQNSLKGYMICNCLSDSDNGKLTRMEILSLKNGEFLPEKPMTADTNALYVWK